MTDAELLDALNALLAPQFEQLLTYAKLPSHFVSAPTAPQGTRATEVMRWAGQSAEQRARVEDALRRVRGVHPAAAPAPGLSPASATVSSTGEAPMTPSTPAPAFQEFGLDAELRAKLDRIRTLLHGPARNVVFPVVGSGLSQGLACWPKLLEELIAQASPDLQGQLSVALAHEKYIKVAGGLEADVRVGRGRIAQAIAQHFRRPSCLRPEPYDLLARLPVDHFATTNFDPWLKDAVSAVVAARGGSARVYIPNDPGAFSDTAPASPPLVLMLHGDADRPESCVLTAESYRELQHGNHANRHGLEALVSQRHWLFVGYSFSDPDLVSLFDAWGQIFGATGGVGAPRHFLLSAALPVLDAGDLLKRGIEPIAYGPPGDHSRLPDVLRYLGQAPRIEPIAVTRGAPVASELASWERAYLGFKRPIWRKGRHDVLAAKGFEVGLADMYVPLNVTAQPWCHVDAQDRLFVESPERIDAQRWGELAGQSNRAAFGWNSSAPLAEQAVTHAALPYVVVQGEAGSGKTVLLQHIAYVLAVAHLTPASVPTHHVDLEGLSEGAPLLRVPVWLDAKRIEELGRSGMNGALVRAVVEAFGDVARLEPETVLEGLESGRYLLLIDALDEVPTVEGRGRVVDALAGLAGAAWPCRFVLTTRPTAHTGSGLPAGAARLEMAALSDEQVERLAWRWCEVQGRSQWHRAELKAAVEGVRERHGADDIVENPMLLTSLFLVFDEEQRLPDSTATLYDKLVDILCALKPAAAWWEGGTALCPAGERRAVLEHIFERMQQAGGTELAVREVAQDLAEWRDAELPSVRAARAFLNGLAERTYLLRFEQRADESGRPEGFVLARHRSVQEYLSACALSKTPASVDVATDRLFAERVGRGAVIDDPAWTGSLGFLVGVYAEQGRGTARAQAYVERLYEHARGGREARVLSLVANALVEYEQYFRGHRLVREVPGEMAKRFEERGGEWPWRDRVLVLEALGRLGDPRLKRDPWVRIVGGTFVMGGDEEMWNSAPAHEVKVGEFLLSRWPVTVEEYVAFVESGGYQEKRWWKWELPEWSEPAEWDLQKRHPNRPVVGVSWYEAMAWCRWASEHRAPFGSWIGLASEEEWEFAARGAQGREYPWGREEPGEEDDARANYRWGATTRPGRPTPVGAFPRGHCGELRDMSGNVWEWTASEWREPESPVEGWPREACQQGDNDCQEDDRQCHEDDKRKGGPDLQSEEGGTLSAAPRVLRGGSWSSGARGLRCAARLELGPGVRSRDFGFRVVCRRFRQHVAIGA